MLQQRALIGLPRRLLMGVRREGRIDFSLQWRRRLVGRCVEKNFPGVGGSMPLPRWIRNSPIFDELDDTGTLGWEAAGWMAAWNGTTLGLGSALPKLIS